MAPKIIFHIGLEKTGSTSFQQYCRRNRPELLKRGVLYPGDRHCFSGASHAPLAASYFSADDARRLLIEPWRADRQTAVASLRREVATIAPDTVLISAEHFSSRFSPERILWLADDFRWADCRIAVVARDHFARALSAYATTIASGRDLTLDAYIDELGRPDNPYLRHEETIGRWERAFGRDRVQIIAYSEGRDIVEILARELIPNARRPGGAANYRLNVSPGASATEALRRNNADRETVGSRTRAAIDSFRRAMRNTPIAASGDAWRLTAEQWRRLDAIARPDRQWLRSRGVDLAPPEPPDLPPFAPR
jgi:hypothetical protein